MINNISHYLIKNSGHISGQEGQIQEKQNKAVDLTSNFSLMQVKALDCIKETIEAFLDHANPSSIADPAEPPGPLQESERPHLQGKEEDMNLGKEISFEFKHKGVVYGKEIIERNDVIKDLRTALKNQMSLLKDKRAELMNKGISNNKAAIENLDNQIKLCQKSLDNSEKVSEDFIKSSFYRDELSKIGPRQNYMRATDDISLGAAVNLRYQKCETPAREIGFFRLGVITDPRNGFTHLGELRELQQDPTKLQTKVKELHDLFKKLKRHPRENAHKLEACQYALAQLHPNNLKKAIQEREHILSQQMLQLVQGQVEKNLTAIMKSPIDEFDITHVALLNRKTDSIDETGWVHNEANEMADMNQIFKDFADKTLIFDGKGPAIDAEGNLHMAQLLEGASGPKEVKLKTNFVNISVQGHTKNDGIQKELNKEGLAQIITIAKNKFVKNSGNPEYKEGLQLLLKSSHSLEKEGKSNYQIAEDISVALVKLKMPMSMGCLSAKDRTGYVGARTVLYFIGKDMKNNPELRNDPKGAEKIHKRFEANILNKQGCAARVVADNTKITVLKCSAAKLPGYSEGVIGKVRRTGYFVKQFAVHPTVADLIGQYTS